MKPVAHFLFETATTNARELVFAAGLALIAYGLSLVSAPAACIVPGGILIWLAIPPATKRSK
jgi:hypothetical protein